MAHSVTANYKRTTRLSRSPDLKLLPFIQTEQYRVKTDNLATKQNYSSYADV